MRLNEVRDGCMASFSLARGDSGPIDRLADFWGSFRAAIPAYPLSILGLAAVQREIPFTGLLILMETIAFVIVWTAFPLALAYASDALGASARYPRYIIAHNWTNLIQAALFTAVLLLSAMGLPAVLAGLLIMLAWIWLLLFKWNLARHGLGIGGGPALGIVTFDMLLRLSVGHYALWVAQRT